MGSCPEKVTYKRGLLAKVLKMPVCSLSCPVSLAWDSCQPPEDPYPFLSLAQPLMGGEGGVGREACGVVLTAVPLSPPSEFCTPLASAFPPRTPLGSLSS